MTWSSASLEKNKAINQKKAALRRRNTIRCPSLPLIPARSTTALVLSSSLPSQKWLPPPLFQGHRLLLSARSPVLLTLQFSALPPRGHLAVSERVLVVPLGRALSSRWRTRVAADHRTVCRAAPQHWRSTWPHMQPRLKKLGFFGLLSSLGHTPLVIQRLSPCLSALQMPCRAVGFLLGMLERLDHFKLSSVNSVVGQEY